MRKFTQIAKLIREKRSTGENIYSQLELSKMIGYKNGQFISNVERGLCSIPLKMLTKISSILSISKDELKDAILKDFSDTLDVYFEQDEKVIEEKES